MNPLIITAYTDIACPWCIIGLHRLDKILRERFAHVAVGIRHAPLLLMPDCPEQGVNLADLLRQRGVAAPAQAWGRPHAEAHGFDRNEALALIHDPQELALTVAASDQARAQGVSSVPHLVIGDRALAGCRSEDEIAAAIAAACIANL